MKHVKLKRRKDRELGRFRAAQVCEGLFCPSQVEVMELLFYVDDGLGRLLW